MPGAELSWDQIEATQNAANKQAGPRYVPGRTIPVPSTVSPSLQTTIAAPYRTPAWDANPTDTADWKTLIVTLGDETASATRDMQEKLGVIMEPTVIAGVKAFILTPKVIPPENLNRLLVNVHGGGYVYNPGVAGTQEPTSMAAYGGFKIISVDYRMPPDPPVSRWPGRLHESVEGDCRDKRSENAGALRQWYCGPKKKACRYRLRSLSERHGWI